MLTFSPTNVPAYALQGCAAERLISEARAQVEQERTKLARSEAENEELRARVPASSSADNNNNNIRDAEALSEALAEVSCSRSFVAGVVLCRSNFESLCSNQMNDLPPC
jgi:hypothetical protein